MLGLGFTRLQLFFLIAILLFLTGVGGSIIGEAAIAYERDRAEQAVGGVNCNDEYDNFECTRSDQYKVEQEMRDGFVESVETVQLVSKLIAGTGMLYLFFARFSWRRQ